MITHEEKIDLLHQSVRSLAEAIRLLCEKNDKADVICIDVIEQLDDLAQHDWED